jgi:hypothetical protein
MRSILPRQSRPRAQIAEAIAIFRSFGNLSRNQGVIVSIFKPPVLSP